jgi:hypothetical protein
MGRGLARHGALVGAGLVGERLGDDREPHRLDPPARDVCVGDADRDAIEPRAERGLAPEPGDRAEHLDEDLLEQVVHVGVRSEHAKEDHVDAPALALKELAVRGLVAQDAATGEGDVVSPRASARRDGALHALTVAGHDEKVTPIARRICVTAWSQPTTEHLNSRRKTCEEVLRCRLCERFWARRS